MLMSRHEPFIVWHEMKVIYDDRCFVFGVEYAHDEAAVEHIKDIARRSVGNAVTVRAIPVSLARKEAS